MEIAKLDQQDIAVKQANKLIESIYKMDVNEHKLLLLATKRVNELEILKKPFTERTKITITSSEFAKQYGISRPAAFEILVEAKKSIYDREFEFLYQDENGDVTPMKSRWFQARGVDSSKSEISFMFASAVIPLIYLVKSEYTLLDLGEIGKLKSKYAVRLYKYLMRWVNAKYRNKIPYDELRTILGLTDTEYTEMCDFRKRVLDIAVKQVREGTGFKDLTVTNHKQGRKVVAFSFHYKDYKNDTIKATAALNNQNDAEEYVIYSMTEAQIKAFSGSIARNIVEGQDGFVDLSSLANAGESTDDLIKRIENDFRSGVFEPYLKVLKILGFKPKAINKKPPSANQSENKGGSNIVDPKGEFYLDPKHFDAYQKRGGKLSQDQLIEIAMAEDMTPIRVILNEVNIFAA